MIDPLFLKALRDVRGQILGWGIGMGLMMAMTILIFPAVQETYRDAQLPESLLAFFGGQGMSMSEPASFLNIEFFSYMPIALAVFAILFGTGALAGEENAGTMELLLSAPVTRTRIVAVKAMALGVALALMLSIVMIFYWVSAPMVSFGVPSQTVLAALGLLWLFELGIAYLSMLFALFFPGRALAGSVLALLVVGSYIVDSMANIAPALESVRPLCITAYFQGSNALEGNVSLPYLAGNLALVLLPLLATFALFQRRDIIARRPIGLKRLLRLHRPVVNEL